MEGTRLYKEHTENRLDRTRNSQSKDNKISFHYPPNLKENEKDNK